jgi:hypothetical protein
MRRDLIGLRSFVIILCAAVAGLTAAHGGTEAGVTVGFCVAAGLHTLVGK